MIKQILASVALVTSFSASVQAGSLGSIEILASAASGNVGGLIGPALSQVGLTSSQVELVQPIVEKSLSAGKKIMKSFNYTPETSDTMEQADLDKMNKELSAGLETSEASLAKVLPEDLTDEVLSFLKGQLPEDLL